MKLINIQRNKCIVRGFNKRYIYAPAKKLAHNTKRPPKKYAGMIHLIFNVLCEKYIDKKIIKGNIESKMGKLNIGPLNLLKNHISFCKTNISYQVLRKYKEIIFNIKINFLLLFILKVYL